MSDPTDLHQLIETQIKPAATQLLKEHKELHDKFGKLLGRLEVAMVKSDADTIRLLLKALTAEVGHLANQLSRAEKLLALLDDAETDDNVEAGLAETEKWTKTLGDLKSLIEKNFTAGKSLEDQAKKKLEELSKGEDQAAREWAVNEAWFRGLLNKGKERLKDIQDAAKDARQAVAAGDAAALKEALQTAKELRDHKPGLADAQRALDELRKNVDVKSLGEDLQDQFERDAASYKKMVDELADLTAEIGKIYAGLEDLEVKPPDYKKAAALLKIPGSQEARLKKALDLTGSAMEKALDALAQDLKLNTTGKAMAAALKKANLP